MFRTSCFSLSAFPEPSLYLLLRSLTNTWWGVGIDSMIQYLWLLAAKTRQNSPGFKSLFFIIVLPPNIWNLPFTISLLNISTKRSFASWVFSLNSVIESLSWLISPGHIKSLTVTISSPSTRTALELSSRQMFRRTNRSSNKFVNLMLWCFNSRNWLRRRRFMTLICASTFINTKIIAWVLYLCGVHLGRCMGCCVGQFELDAWTVSTWNFLLICCGLTWWRTSWRTFNTFIMNSFNWL